MINAIIIDDEQHSIDSLAADVAAYCMQVNIIGKGTSPLEGLELIRKLKPQLVFLDVDMPQMNGFEMLGQLPVIDFSIIFTTAFDQFAAMAFRISAVDYLLKPIDSTDLIAAVKKAEEKIEKETGLHHIENLLHNIRQPERQKIALSNSDGYEFVAVNAIDYCTAEGAYTNVHIKDRRTMLISKTLGDIEEMLPKDMFVRIHHSTVVNIGAISHYSRTDGGFVTVNSKEKLAVSKSRKEILLQQLGLK